MWEAVMQSVISHYGDGEGSSVTLLSEANEAGERYVVRSIINGVERARPFGISFYGAALGHYSGLRLVIMRGVVV
jgi:hypothetical protein